jgi:hypothetical protein
MMSTREAVLSAARMGLQADTPENGFEQIRSMCGSHFSDTELAEAVAKAVGDRLVHDPVRLLPGCLQCFWQLELAEVADGRA